MPCLRQSSGTGTPASASFKIAMIWLSVYLGFFIESPYAENSTRNPDQFPGGLHRYLKQIFEAYSDHKGDKYSSLADLEASPDLQEHYQRQRENFYHAESLRNFARDNVPQGTFESLQDEVHSGVKEVESSSHKDGLVRMNAVTQAAAQLPLTANGLISVTKIQDKRGICHQLANVDRLQWVKS